MTTEPHLTDAVLAAIPAGGWKTSAQIADETGITRVKVISLLSGLESSGIVTGRKLFGCIRWKHESAKPPASECENDDLINS